VYRRILLAVSLAIISHATLFAQNLTGIWRGYFITESGDEYKFELQIKQTGNTISGVSYSYLTTVFYGKATLTGSFNKTAQSALIREIKTVELRMSGFSQACIMKCLFRYDRSGKEEFLEGTFTSMFEKNGFGVQRGDDCGDGKVYLRKVPTSDFYIEPFLRKKPSNKPVIVNQPPMRRDTVKSTVKKPVTTTTKKPGTPTTTPTKKPVTTTTAKKPVTDVGSNPTTRKPVESKSDSLKKIQPPNTRVTVQKPGTPNPDVLLKRVNELVKTIVVRDPEVTVKLYDNGEIDGDTISVYLDSKLVLSAKRLSASPLVVKLKMEKEKADYELVMVAENLGKIPPNTSLMIVEAGDQRFDVRITSTEQKNAMVRFRYEPSE